MSSEVKDPEVFLERQELEVKSIAILGYNKLIRQHG